MRVGIVGAGALGTLFGYHLARAGHEVTLVERRTEVAEAIARDGLVLDGETAAARASTDARTAERAQVLFVFVRATDTLTALRPFAANLDPACAIVTLQNGIGNEEAIKAALGGNIALVLGATTENALNAGPGVAQRIGVGTTVVGSGGASPETCSRVARLLEESGLRASAAYDIRPHLWGKLVATAAISPVAALLDRPAGIILDDPDAGELARSLAQEAATVAGAMRIALPFSEPWTYVREIAQMTATLEPSMLSDLRAGARTEIDAINGAVVAAGRRATVPTPYNDAMVRLVKARERVRR